MSTTQTNAIIERHDRHLALNYPRYPVALVGVLLCAGGRRGTASAV